VQYNYEKKRSTSGTPLSLGRCAPCLLPSRITLDIQHRSDRSSVARLLGRRELGDGLGTLRDGVLGELSGEDKSDRGLDLSGRDGGSVVVRGELGSLRGDSLEDVRDERVEDGHGLVAAGER